jgi:hypothetical protein
LEVEIRMTREQIINNMCMTFRHDYGLVISEDDRMYTLNSGMTEREREALFNDMAQIFDHNFATVLEEYRKVNEGESITLPKSKEHAEAMLRVANWYLETNK